MSFQSILQREGWRPQNHLFTKLLCQNCLSRSMPPFYRRWASTIPQQKTVERNLLDHFREELYHPEKYVPDPNVQSYSPLVKTTITRRLTRKRLLKSYWRLKTKDPQRLAELTRQDIDQFISRFVVNSDDLVAKRPMVQIFYILQELKNGRFEQVSFGPNEAEHMICLAAELKWTDKCLALLHEIALKQKLSLSIRTYDAVFQLLSENKNLQEMEFWLNHMKEQSIGLTERTIRSVFLCHLGRGQAGDGIAYVKQNAKGSKLLSLIDEYGDDKTELLPRLLSYFAMQALSEKQLYVARNIYIQKIELGLSSNSLLRRIMRACIQANELHTAEVVLRDTISIQDTKGAQLCADLLIDTLLHQRNIVHSVSVWQKMTQSGIELSQQTVDKLLVHCAKYKYHADVLRLYKRYQKVYPNMSYEARVRAVRCMVLVREYPLAKKLAEGLVAHIRNMDHRLGKLAARTFFSLSAKTGDIELFEQTFSQIEDLGPTIRHRGLTSLMACYIKRGDLLAAKSAFKSMADYTKGPDVVDFNLLMRTVLLEDKTINHEKILEILKHMALVNITPNQTTIRHMIQYYEQGSSMLNELYKKLLEMPLRKSDQVILNNMAIDKLLTKYSVEYVANLFFKNDRGLILPGENGKAIDRDTITYKMLLSACLSDNKPSLTIAERLIKDMLSRGIKPSMKHYVMFIELLGKKGNFRKARKYIKNMEENTGEKPKPTLYLNVHHPDSMPKSSKDK
ncbi:hypothetical protein CU097_007618 [Rhizopus azygosporus]|uniref:Pentacotripeptide-repeat region of PRORP domain-containing protein n=2 Tax=Rhizopus TaxID=4842 RepID=A0A367JTC3_RHIAZ|nr:hypothetical protein BCV71DRAFT_239409 [Rhizopus microsporus]RCH93222.1 hypothetical protein CU097_007618 [Rhizopus azygosporus]